MPNTSTILSAFGTATLEVSYRHLERDLQGVQKFLDTLSPQEGNIMPSKLVSRKMVSRITHRSSHRTFQRGRPLLLSRCEPDPRP